MAFEIWRHNLSDTKRYFDVTFVLNYQQYSQTTNITRYPLETCTKDYFKDYPEISNNFKSLQAGEWLCLPLNTTLSLSGKYSSASYNQYIVQVSACKNETEP
jgi:predicted transcriptional regulator